MKIGFGDIASFAIGGAGGLLGYNRVKSINAQNRRNKSYIEDAYAGARQREGVHEADVRQGGAEQLAARGLLVPGAQYSQTSPSLTQSAYGGGMPSTLGGQQQADTNRELGLERHDLDAAHTRALNENKSEYTNALINFGTNTASSIVSAYATGGMMNSVPSATPSMQPPAPSMSLSGENGEGSLIGAAYNTNPGHAFGVDALDPLGARRGTVGGYGQPNSEFHVGG